MLFLFASERLSNIKIAHVLRFLISPAGPEEEDRPRHPQAGVGVGESEVPGAEGRQGLGDRGRRQDGDRAGGELGLEEVDRVLTSDWR